LPDVARELAQRARAQGVSIETLVNVFLVEHIRETA
jgi:post-segregation antitoxin (ccd killing protein)